MTLTTGLLIALIVPVFFALMSLRTGNFYYNICMTGSCIVLLFAMPNPIVALPVIVCFALSILGDYFMGHHNNSNRYYIFGMCTFFLAHVALVWYSYNKMDYAVWQLVLCGVLAIGYGIYLAMRIMPKVNDHVIRVAIIAYASISVIALTMGISLNVPMLQRVLYALGVASIVFSDTLICESDFVGNQRPARLIMPTYFLCHILITASLLVSTM